MNQSREARHWRFCYKKGKEIALLRAEGSALETLLFSVTARKLLGLTLYSSPLQCIVHHPISRDHARVLCSLQGPTLICLSLIALLRAAATVVSLQMFSVTLFINSPGDNNINII